MQLDDHVPLEVTLDDLDLRAPEPDALLDFLAQMEFRTLSKRIATQLGVEAPEIPEPAAQADDGGDPPEEVPFDAEGYTCIHDATTLVEWIARAHARGYVAVDTETTGLDEMTAGLVGVCLAVEPGQAAYLPLQHKEGEGDLFGGSDLVEGQMGWMRRSRS